ncbi:MAG: hypothetical protein LAQ30_26825 [Acidobacteriia bacterium]|nr:hypothetical protein [Terriglobia bacterium]
MTIEPTGYKGWPNCWKVANGSIELIVTADVGPRVIHLGFAGGQNFFKNYPEQMGRSGEAEWMIRGGSRIWIGPEDVRATYAADNSPVEIAVEGNALIATAPVEEPVRLQKQMIVRMDPGAARVEMIHRIRNAGLLPVEFAPWILTVMAPGGVGITGFPPRGTHPEVLPPTHPLVMWAFTDLSDPRWVFMKKYLALKQDPAARSPQKIGLFNPRTWGAYLLHGELFVKRYEANPDAPYPDFGCSFEMFTNADMLELETMGPLGRVAPGEWVEHVERWELRRGVSVASWTDEGLDRTLL